MDLLQALPLEEVSSDLVLQTAGVSRGSLYHHFEDFSDLLETAQTRHFSRFVDESISLITDLIARASTKQEIVQAVQEFSRLTQLPENSDRRFGRVRLLGLAWHNPRLTAKLAVEQDRLTEALTRLFELAQQGGWMKSDFEPQVAAVFIQAYTLGRVIDDISMTKVDPLEWNRLVMKVIEMVFGLGENPEAT
jgi:AcrR family transcriptional regulator